MVGKIGSLLERRMVWGVAVKTTITAQQSWGQRFGCSEHALHSKGLFWCWAYFVTGALLGAIPEHRTRKNTKHWKLLLKNHKTKQNKPKKAKIITYRICLYFLKFSIFVILKEIKTLLTHTTLVCYEAKLTMVFNNFFAICWTILEVNDILWEKTWFFHKVHPDWLSLRIKLQEVETLSWYKST